MTRGRRPNLDLPATPSLNAQRAFRERKRKHLVDLEESVVRLTRENEELKQQLQGLPASTPRGHSLSIPSLPSSSSSSVSSSSSSSAHIQSLSAPGQLVKDLDGQAAVVISRGSSSAAKSTPCKTCSEWATAYSATSTELARLRALLASRTSSDDTPPGPVAPAVQNATAYTQAVLPPLASIEEDSAMGSRSPPRKRQFSLAESSSASSTTNLSPSSTRIISTSASQSTGTGAAAASASTAAMPASAAEKGRRTSSVACCVEEAPLKEGTSPWNAAQRSCGGALRHLCDMIDGQAAQFQPGKSDRSRSASAAAASSSASSRASTSTRSMPSFSLSSRTPSMPLLKRADGEQDGAAPAAMAQTMRPWHDGRLPSGTLVSWGPSPARTSSMVGYAPSTTLPLSPFAQSQGSTIPTPSRNASIDASDLGAASAIADMSRASTADVDPQQLGGLSGSWNNSMHSAFISAGGSTASGPGGVGALLAFGQQQDAGPATWSNRYSLGSTVMPSYMRSSLPSVVGQPGFMRSEPTLQQNNSPVHSIPGGSSQPAVTTTAGDSNNVSSDPSAKSGHMGGLEAFSNAVEQQSRGTMFPFAQMLLPVNRSNVTGGVADGSNSDMSSSTTQQPVVSSSLPDIHDVALPELKEDECCYGLLKCDDQNRIIL